MNLDAFYIGAIVGLVVFSIPLLWCVAKKGEYKVPLLIMGMGYLYYLTLLFDKFLDIKC